MADSPILPGDRAWKDASGRPLPVEFYRFLRDLVGYITRIDGNTAELADILARLEALESEGSLTVQDPASVSWQQSDNLATVQLVGDSANPGADLYYGTDETGGKGFFTLPESDSTVPYFVPDGENYTVHANKQALWKLPISLGVGSSLTVLGALEQVT